MIWCYFKWKINDSIVNLKWLIFIRDFITHAKSNTARSLTHKFTYCLQCTSFKLIVLLLHISSQVPVWLLWSNVEKWILNIHRKSVTQIISRSKNIKNKKRVKKSKLTRHRLLLGRSQLPLSSIMEEVLMQQDLKTLVALAEQAYPHEAPCLEEHNSETSCWDYWNEENAVVYINTYSMTWSTHAYSWRAAAACSTDSLKKVYKTTTLYSGGDVSYL